MFCDVDPSCIEHWGILGQALYKPSKRLKELMGVVPTSSILNDGCPD